MENLNHLKNKKITLYSKLTFCLGNLLAFSLSNNTEQSDGLPAQPQSIENGGQVWTLDKLYV